MFLCLDSSSSVSTGKARSCARTRPPLLCGTPSPREGLALTQARPPHARGRGTRGTAGVDGFPLWETLRARRIQVGPQVPESTLQAATLAACRPAPTLLASNQRRLSGASAARQRCSSGARAEPKKRRSGDRAAREGRSAWGLAFVGGVSLVPEQTLQARSLGSLPPCALTSPSNMRPTDRPHRPTLFELRPLGVEARVGSTRI